MRILIAGGTAVTRRAIKTLLQNRPENELVQEIADIGSLVLEAASRQFDLVLINNWLSAETVTEHIQSLRNFLPDVDIVILSGRPEAKQAALSAGADAFVLKGDPPRYLLTAIETIRLRRDDV